MTQEEKDRNEEQKWLNSVKKKFMKYISNLNWDNIKLTDTELTIVTFIMNAKTPDDLPILVNERIVDHILEKVKNQLNNLKTKGI